MQMRSSSWTAIQFPPELYSALSGKSRVAALMKNPAFEEGGREGGPFQRPVEHGGALARRLGYHNKSGARIRQLKAPWSDAAGHDPILKP